MHGTMNMRRKNSRKGFVVVREPNGRIQREGQEHAPTAIRRLRDAALNGMRDSEWGTELGRLYLQRVITEGMYLAGRRWREEAETWRHSIGVFPVRGVSLDRGRSHPPDPDTERGREEAKRDADGAERFFEAHAILVGSGAEILVRRLCEDNENLCGFYELQVARGGLSKLADHYGLTGHGKNVR